MISYKMDPIRINVRLNSDRNVEDDYWKKIPSHDSRESLTPKKKTYKTNHTIAPAYNKGPYQVISQSNIKDIGR
jgi:hypothetical protein